MQKIWREPLIHFTLLGAALFAAHAVWQQKVTKADYTISVSTAELERQAVIFAGENRRQPTDEDIQALLFSYVEEQALMREAERLGLGDDDTIIKRRLAQKMRFMIEDVTPPGTPDDADLEAWFNDNVSDFISPERRSFKHIYLSPESRGDDISLEAETLLAQASSQDWKTLGDPFMMPREYDGVERAAVERSFGKAFAESLFQAEGSEWQGPISSAYGLHIIRIDEATPKFTPVFEDVKPRVITAWTAQAQRAHNMERLEALIGKYKVEIEGLE